MKKRRAKEKSGAREKRGEAGAPALAPRLAFRCSAPSKRLEQASKFVSSLFSLLLAKNDCGLPYSVLQQMPEETFVVFSNSFKHISRLEAITSM